MVERWSSRHCLVDCAKDSRWVLPARWRTKLWWLNSRLLCVLAWLLLALFWFAVAMEDTSPLLPWWSRIWFDVQRWSSRRRCSGNDGGDVASSMVVVATWRSMASVSLQPRQKRDLWLWVMTEAKRGCLLASL